VDSCGNEVVTSNIGRTIYLLAEPSSDMKNILTWNEYEDWLGSVSMYNIYRKVDDVVDLNPLVTLPSGTLTYSDDVSTFTETAGRFSYMIQALEGPGNPYLCTDTSFSNESLALQPPRFYVPNAFVPKGVNTIFLPLNVFVNTEDYLFTVYNRWGMMIFQTTDTKVGWDGTFQGDEAPQGVYVYSISYKNSQNKMIEKHGTVTLMR
jgi:gliding motility-associated-like protein